MEPMYKVIRGQAIWVLPEGSHAHERHETRCRVFYGHAMHPDGLADLARLSAYVVAPRGDRLSLKVEPGDDKFHLVAFAPDREGFWPLTVEYDLGPVAIAKDGFYRRGTRKNYPDAREVSYYYQYAKTYVQVGHFCTSCGGVHPPEIIRLGHDLELIVAPNVYRVGDELILEVCYRGRPLPGTIVMATWSLREEEDWALATKTDDAGRVKFILSNPGHWLFYTRYADETMGKENEYDKRVYSATVSLFGVR